ncbi:MAG: MFS transporter [Dehalococcoidales bacterium]
MKLFSKNGTDKKDNSLSLFHVEAAAINAESAGCNFQSASIIATGADASSVALLSTFTNLVLAMLLIKVPSLVEGKTPMKKTIVTMALVNAFTWIPIVFVFLFFKHINPLLLIALWIFGLVPATLLGPLRDNWLANLVPSEKMGRYLSFRSVVSSLFYLIAYNIMGFTLSRATGNVFSGFAIVLGIAFLASVASTFLYSNIHSPAPAAKSDSAPSLSFVNFLKGAMKEHLGTFIMFAALFNFAVNLSGPLLAVYMLTNLKFSFMTYTLVLSCVYVGRVISMTFWGKMVDKSGSLRVLGIVSHLIPFVPLLWLFSGNIGYLCVVQLFSGVVQAAFDLSCQTFIYKSTQPEQRLHYIVYCKSLTTFAAAAGTLTGALLLTHMLHIFGSQILGIFLLSAITQMAVVRFMLPKLRPGGIPDAIVHEELARELAMVNYPTRQGLYYHPEAWSRFTKPVAAFGTAIGKAVNKLAPQTSGLYYNHEKWANYMGRNSTLEAEYSNSETEPSGLYYNKKAWADYRQQTAVLVESDSESAKEGLLYNPETWAKMVNQTAQASIKAPESTRSTRKGLLYDPEAWASIVNQMAQADAKFSESLKPARKGLLYDPEAMAKFVKQTTLAEAKAIDTKPARTGIFYDSQKWNDYLKQSMLLNATTMRTIGDVQTNRTPIFYHPEAWNNYKNQTALSRTATTKTRAGATPRQALLYHPEEWERTFDPVMVHIGRKSAIGTVISRQSQTKKIDRKAPPVSHQPLSNPTLINRRIGTRPSMA